MPKSDVTEMTNKIVDQLGTCDLDTALMVLCNLLGQVIAAQSDMKPSLIQKIGDNVAENVKAAAIKKIMHDNDARLKH